MNKHLPCKRHLFTNRNNGVRHKSCWYCGDKKK